MSLSLEIQLILILFRLLIYLTLSFFAWSWDINSFFKTNRYWKSCGDYIKIFAKTQPLNLLLNRTKILRLFVSLISWFSSVSVWANHYRISCTLSVSSHILHRSLLLNTYILHYFNFIDFILHVILVLSSTL
jgi:hypothetical protein